MPRKIAIIGGPGTGKTTLSYLLYPISKIPIYHLDSIGYSENWKKRSKQEKQAILSTILKKDTWIIEGNTTKFLTPIVEKADLIIFLDYSSFSQLRGILTRFFLGKGKDKQEVKGCKEKISIKFLFKTLLFNRTKRPFIYHTLSKKKHSSILIFQNSNQLNDWLDIQKTIRQ